MANAFVVHIAKTLRSFLVIGKPKIFVLSFQRSGTKSVAQFFNKHGFYGCGHADNRTNWSVECATGNYEVIFKSVHFRSAQVYTDTPWFYPGFYKVLFWRFPKSKFIFLERNADKWFDSMVSHSKGKTLGNTHVHAMMYKRTDEFLRQEGLGLFDQSVWNGMEIAESMRAHYKKVYYDNIAEMELFFKHHDPDGKRFFHGKLEDAEVWEKMGRFAGIKNITPKVYHSHKTKKTVVS